MADSKQELELLFATEPDEAFRQLVILLEDPETAEEFVASCSADEIQAWIKRLEEIDSETYGFDNALRILRRYLLPQRMAEAGLTEEAKLLAKERKQARADLTRFAGVGMMMRNMSHGIGPTTGASPNMNVAKFKEQLLGRFGCKSHFDFCAISDNHRAFWNRLNRIWKTKGVSAETTDNVDRAAQLTQTEWDELERESHGL